MNEFTREMNGKGRVGMCCYTSKSNLGNLRIITFVEMNLHEE